VDRIDLTEISEEMKAAEKLAATNNIALSLSDLQVVTFGDPFGIPSDLCNREVSIVTPKGRFIFLQRERFLQRGSLFIWVSEQLTFEPTEGQRQVLQGEDLQKLLN